MSQGIDIFQTGRSLDFIIAAVNDGAAFGGTTGKQTMVIANKASVVLFNPAASGKTLHLFGLQVLCDTAGIFLSVATIAADPAFTLIASINKHRGSAQAPVALLENNANDATAAPLAANTTDTLLTQANAEFPYFGSDLVGTKLVAGTGIRIYFPAQAGAVNYAVNMDWVEY